MMTIWKLTNLSIPFEQNYATKIQLIILLETPKMPCKISTQIWIQNQAAAGRKPIIRQACYSAGHNPSCVFLFVRFFERPRSLRFFKKRREDVANVGRSYVTHVVRTMCARCTCVFCKSHLTVVGACIVRGARCRCVVGAYNVRATYEFPTIAMWSYGDRTYTYDVLTYTHVVRACNCLECWKHEHDVAFSLKSWDLFLSFMDLLK